jgi:hypothetical protein
MPTGADERHLVTIADETSKDLVQMRLRSARLGILAILPVDDGYAHR